MVSKDNSLITVCARIIISFVVLGTGVYLVVSSGDDGKVKVGVTFIGLVVGYWLR